MGNRWTSAQAQIVGRIGGAKAGVVKRRRACERAVGPLDRLVRKTLFDLRPDLTLSDVKPLLDLLPMAYQSGYERGYRSGWKRNTRQVGKAA
jgi:hypothetical protein